MSHSTITARYLSNAMMALRLVFVFAVGDLEPRHSTLDTLRNRAMRRTSEEPTTRFQISAKISGADEVRTV